MKWILILTIINQFNDSPFSGTYVFSVEGAAQQAVVVKEFDTKTAMTKFIDEKVYPKGLFASYKIVSAFHGKPVTVQEKYREEKRTVTEKIVDGFEVKE